jgi:hypothetical protein
VIPMNSPLAGIFAFSFEKLPYITIVVTFIGVG